MKTLLSNRFVSVVVFPVINPAVGVVFGYQGPGYRYIWTLDLAVWRRELSIRWWNRSGARVKKRVQS